MNIDYKLIGSRIQQERKRKGYTQEYLAERLDVTVGYVSQVERGITKISLDLLGAVSGVLGCKPESLIADAAPAQENYLVSELLEDYAKLSASERRVVTGMIRLLLENRN